MFTQHQSRFSGRHQAGIKTDEVKGDVCFRQGFIKLGKGHRTSVRVFFIIAIAGNGTSAMIPQYEFITVGFKVLLTEFDEAD